MVKERAFFAVEPRYANGELAADEHVVLHEWHCHLNHPDGTSTRCDVRKQPTKNGVVIVASAEEQGVEEQLNLNASSRVLVQPTTLRDVRSSIADVLQSNMKRE